jgi:CheY-like chemotaxis protein
MAEESGRNPSPVKGRYFTSQFRPKVGKTMKNARAGKPVEILLVEDNPGDVRLTIEGLKEGKVNNNLHVVEDGVEAMAFLRQEGKYSEAVRPDLILLDLNLPKKDGREVLTEIKADKNLRFIPVVVLTTSEAEQDILKAYMLHANCYITKPVDLEQFISVVSSIEDFWFTIVKLPKSE